MKKESSFTRLAIVGGGPTALLLLRRLVDIYRGELEVIIFEKTDRVGAGMPYSKCGANDEHITNISGNEIPQVLDPLEDWVTGLQTETLDRFHLSAAHFNAYKALPRLLFGDYLESQFKEVLQEAKQRGITVDLRFKTEVKDIHYAAGGSVTLIYKGGKQQVDKVVICTGHHWPKKLEGKQPNYFDSPYPPFKLAKSTNYNIAVRGASLTAIDAVRTLARNNGYFYTDAAGVRQFELSCVSPRFKMTLHSRNGLLPAVRFHLDDPQLGRSTLLRKDEIDRLLIDNDGFVPLDYVYEHVFLQGIREKQPELYASVKGLRMEDFVAKMLEQRGNKDAFALLQWEYEEAATSIERRESIHWKELLAVLSFALNYPAKYFSAEDMLRLTSTLKPLISLIIAFVPQKSVEEILALHRAGVLNLVDVGDDSRVEPSGSRGVDYYYTDQDGQEISKHFDMFVDCIGQPALSYTNFPFGGLKQDDTVVPAKIRFRDRERGQQSLSDDSKAVQVGVDGEYYLSVPGIAINDSFQVTDAYGGSNTAIYLLAVPFIGGYNPDYSGLDFAEEASLRVVNALML
ncbi:FAD/NAD(P)-binding protein [Sphingobacterium paludis]|uniref:FAD-NAD(P)-binding protein n=1 Tax=Sphingobacterium paludis TaxID=1476465 RepID=A0A4R7CWP6_9SPHI|nr:FAD/NAD(P)-binding protein [Sphingobacterium paludis]TDS12933.1 FAD-NAD(P)-binding protein [Sphingobacterium paludis]